jgi:hypothetical protein
MHFLFKIQQIFVFIIAAGCTSSNTDPCVRQYDECVDIFCDAHSQENVGTCLSACNACCVLVTHGLRLTGNIFATACGITTLCAEVLTHSRSHKQKLVLVQISNNFI